MNFDEKEEQNMAQNIIGERIAGLLREQGKSQRKLAEQAGTVVILNTELMHINMETITFRDKFTPPNEEEDDIMTLLYVVMAIGMIGLYVELGKGHEA